MPSDRTNFFGSGPVGDQEPGSFTLVPEEDQDQLLHLVLPANSLNFLNGLDSGSIFDTAANSRCFGGDPEASGIETDFDNLMLEVTCKVQEINKVFYRQADTDEDLYN